MQMHRESWIHLCVDMQRMFVEDTPWQVAWMPKVFDAVLEVTTRFPQQTIFTRFVPPSSTDELPGMWRDYLKAKAYGYRLRIAGHCAWSQTLRQTRQLLRRAQEQ